MANWCSNVVSFTGDKEMVKQAKKLFREMGRKGKKEMRGQMPEFVSKEHPYFYDTYVKKDKVYYLTKWKPNNDALQEIAYHFNIGFRNRYDDLPMGLLGEMTYKDGRFRDVQLDNYDLELYRYSDDQQAYIYNEIPYVDEWQAITALLDDKIQFISRNAIPVSQIDDNGPFSTTSRIGKNELTEYYSDLSFVDLVLKMAEYGNFTGARKEFQAWDEEFIIEVDNYLTKSHQHGPELYKTQEKYVAVCFLKELIQEWRNELSAQQENNDSIAAGRKPGR